TAAIPFGNGDGTFQQAQEIQNFGAGVFPIGIIVADFNGDGRMDFAVSNVAANTVAVFIGNGDGTFQPARMYPTASDPESIAVGDFNGDGKLDLAVASDIPGASVSVLLGNGDGTFSPDPAPARPVLSPPGGTFNVSVQVTITDATAGAAIYYTTDGSTPTTSSSPYSGPIAVNQTMTIRAIAAAPGFAPSAVATATYTILQPAPAPTFNPLAGTYVGSQTVTISESAPGATIYYTTDGSTPTTSSTRYTGPIVVNQSVTIRAIAAAQGFASSSVATATYTILQPAPAPTFSPPAGTFVGPQTVTVSDS